MIGADLKQKLIESAFLINDEYYNGLIRTFIKSDNLNYENSLNIKFIQLILNKAISYKQIELVKLLLKYGADPNYKICAEAPIINAIIYNTPEIVELLLKYGANPNDIYISDISYIREPILIFATKYNRLEIVKLLIKYNADLNMKDNDDNTALDWAKHRDYNDIANELMKMTNNPNKTSEELLNEARLKLKKILS